jgi:hypothetical protein
MWVDEDFQPSCKPAGKTQPFYYQRTRINRALPRDFDLDPNQQHVSYCSIINKISYNHSHLFSLTVENPRIVSPCQKLAAPETGGHPFGHLPDWCP